MKKIAVLSGVFAVAFWMVLSPRITLPQEKPPTWEVSFSPHGGCTNAIIRELNKTKSTILVQAYPFSFAPIVKALLNLG